MLAWVMNLGFAAGPVVTDQAGVSSLVAFWAGGAGAAVAAGPVGNIIFSQGYNMIHPVHESPLRPTDLTEIIVRKRDKKPIISGGDH